MFTKGLFAAITTLLIAGCSLDAGGTGTGDINAPIAAERLQAPADFDVLTNDASVVSLELGGSWVTDDESHVVTDLAVTAGNIRVRSEGGNLFVEELELHIEDIDVASDLTGPNGWHATDLKLTLASELRLNAESDDSWSSAKLELELSWNAVVSNGTAPLATQKLQKMPIEARLERSDDGDLKLQLTVDGEGMLWNFGDMIELNRVEIDLMATT